MTATMPSTLPCCWLVWASYCHTTASSLMWTIFTTSTQVSPSAICTALKGSSVPSAWARAFWESQGVGSCLEMLYGENFGCGFWGPSRELYQAGWMSNCGVAFIWRM